MTQKNNLPIYLLLLVIFLCLLSACTTEGATPVAVCKALLTPIEYNSTNPKSERFAGRKLAPDLAQHNRVGMNLACPEYRRW